MAIKPNLNSAEAAEYLGVKPETLNQWRYLGRGPSYVKSGRAIIYRLKDLDAWLDANTVTPGVSA
ncbi:hypothetical protein GCM10009624_10590 [Gordonia sinesedis]